MDIKNLFNKIFKSNANSSKKGKDEDVLNIPGLLSNDYQKKLALIIKNFKDIEYQDLKFVKHRKLEENKKDDLLTSYRLDFHSKEALIRFKKKYKHNIL